MKCRRSVLIAESYLLEKRKKEKMLLRGGNIAALSVELKDSERLGLGAIIRGKGK